MTGLLITTHLLAVALGILIGAAYTRIQITKREASRRDLAAELRSPVEADFETIRRIAEGA